MLHIVPGPVAITFLAAIVATVVAVGGGSNDLRNAAAEVIASVEPPLTYAASD